MGDPSSFPPDAGPTSASGRLTDFVRAALRHIRLIGPVAFLGLMLAGAIITVLAASALIDWPMHVYSMTPTTILIIALGGTLCICAWSIGKNISKQKLQLDTALNNMQQGLLLFDATGRLVLYNQHFLQMYRLSPGEVKLGCTLSDLLRLRKAAGTFQGDPDRFVAKLVGAGGEFVGDPDRAVAKLFQGGKVQTKETELPDGRIISITNQSTPDHGWVSVHEDVTAQKRAEREIQEAHVNLRLQNIKLDAALQNMSQGLVMFDADRKLVFCNRQYADLYRLPPELMTPGVRQTEILERRAASGIIPKSHALEYLKDRADKTVARVESDSLVELSDGRTLSVAIRPLSSGGWVSTHEDITERRRAEAQIAHMAHHDSLTDLPNRLLLRERLEAALARVRQGERLAVLYLDLDHFKNINDTLGHSVGDELLKAMASRVRACIKDTDTLARLGGDEFAIILADLTQPVDAATLARRIRDAVTVPFEFDGHRMLVDVSIGISVAPNDGVDADQLLKNADMALYGAKADGRGTHRFFEAGMDARMKARRALELDLRKAIANGEFELYYQPLVNLDNDQVTACEALLRWHHPERGLISPVQFIPIAEETGLIAQLGEWVVKRACADAATWPDHMVVSVNVSPAQFKNQSLALTIVGALASSGLPARRLEIEITETVLMQHNEGTLAVLHQLRDLGVRIAMDDFGTGCSSLSSLRSFPFDKIKIDRSFIHELSEQEESVAIVRAVISLARSLNMTTTAEGVETQSQLEKVRALGCTEMQGYLHSAPMPLRDLIGLFPARRERTGSAA